MYVYIYSVLLLFPKTAIKQHNLFTCFSIFGESCNRQIVLVFDAICLRLCNVIGYLFLSFLYFDR